jgi:hypothetical protein
MPEPSTAADTIPDTARRGARSVDIRANRAVPRSASGDRATTSTVHSLRGTTQCRSSAYRCVVAWVEPIESLELDDEVASQTSPHHITSRSPES